MPEMISVIILSKKENAVGGSPRRSQPKFANSGGLCLQNKKAAKRIRVRDPLAPDILLIDPHSAHYMRKELPVKRDALT